MRSALLALALLGQAAQDGAVEHVLVVSYDGLRPEFYLGDWDAPTLKAMAREGAHARGVESVFPSSTYPAHTSIVTGVRPARHGIHANTLWGENGGRREWYWWTKDVKARTLWQAARDKDRKVAVTYWPCTVGADVDWLVAEAWDPDGLETVKRLQTSATPGLVMELALAVGIPAEKALADRATIDQFITGAACYVFGKYKPHLQLVHLTHVDEAQHKEGRDSPAVRAAVRRQDDNLARIRKAVEASGLGPKTLLIVVGDHGFVDVSEQVNPNALLVEAGFAEAEGDKLKSWRALAHSHGGSASVYVKDAADVRKVTEVLRRGENWQGRKLYSVIERPELDELGFNKRAALALDPEEGIGFSGQLTGALLEGAPRVRGMHGQRPRRQKLLTGLVAAGAGVRKGASRDRARLIDVAPTVARLLGLDMPDVEGVPLTDLLANP